MFSSMRNRILAGIALMIIAGIFGGYQWGLRSGSNTVYAFVSSNTAVADSLFTIHEKKVATVDDLFKITHNNVMLAANLVDKIYDSSADARADAFGTNSYRTVSRLVADAQTSIAKAHLRMLNSELSIIESRAELKRLANLMSASSDSIRAFGGEVITSFDRHDVKGFAEAMTAQVGATLALMVMSKNAALLAQDAKSQAAAIAEDLEYIKSPPKYSRRVQSHP